MAEYFFDGWSSVLRTLLLGICAYAGLILLLRASGKRTLSKMNAFDLVVTVALGSTLATILLSKDVSLAQGIVALGLLIVLQFFVAWASYRSRLFKQLVKNEPRLLFHRGDFLHQSLRRERVTEDEVRAAVRSQGLAGLGDVQAVVLETDGSLSVIAADDAQPPSSLHDVHDARTT